MKEAIFLVALAAVYCTVESKSSPPKVQVYSSGRGEFGQANILICHVTDFHPPDITISIRKNGVEIPNSNQTDLAFNKEWHFHLTKSVAFTPLGGEEYSCDVVHEGSPRKYAWDPGM